MSWAAARTLVALPSASPERPPRGAPRRRGGSPRWYGGTAVRWVAGPLVGMARWRAAAAFVRVGAHLWLFARHAGGCGGMRAPLRVCCSCSPGFRCSRLRVHRFALAVLHSLPGVLHLQPVLARFFLRVHFGGTQGFAAGRWRRVCRSRSPVKRYFACAPVRCRALAAYVAFRACCDCSPDCSPSR
eukprot:1619314-Alexandrium_andersonii.AAC.1